MPPGSFKRLGASILKPTSRRVLEQTTRSGGAGPLSTSAATSRRGLRPGFPTRRTHHQEAMAAAPEHEKHEKHENEAGSKSGTKAEDDLPPLSARDFETYNRLAEQMDLFHNRFRSQWILLWNACLANRRPSNLTLKQFLDEGLAFARYLTMHHNIEESYFFPLLAKRMPAFQKGGGGGGGELIRQHREIHAGLDGFEAYLNACRARQVDFELDVLRGKMESWGGVLWTHLDEEVKTLGAENMRRYWSLEEMRNFII